MSLYLRKADYADRDLLFEWANDDMVRANAFHTGKIPYENHVRWFDRMMSDPSVYQYILCEGDTPVGQLRLNVEEGEALIDYSVSSGLRGRGYGSEMLRMIQPQLAKERISNVIKMVGQVRYENRASARAFEKCGFRRKELPEYIQYERVLLNEDYHCDGQVMEYRTCEGAAEEI